MTIIVILILLAIVLSLVIGASYNSFIHRKNAVEYAYHSLETIIQKRHDLLPKLAEVVRQKAAFEQQLLQQTEALLALQQPRDLPAAALVRQENQLARTVQQITTILSKDAGMRQHESFMHLQRAIVEVEAQISAARRAYNATVMEYNNAVQMFPTALFATLLQLQAIDPLDLAVIDAEFEQIK